MADQPPRDATSQGGGCSLSFNMLNAVVRDSIRCDWTRRIEEYIVLSGVARRVHAKREQIAGRNINVEFCESCIPKQLRRIEPGLQRELGRGGEYQALVARLIVARRCRSSARLRNDYASAVHKANNCRLMENVLIVSQKEEGTIAAKRASKGKAELVLLAGGLDIQCWVACVEAAVTQI